MPLASGCLIPTHRQPAKTFPTGHRSQGRSGLSCRECDRWSLLPEKRPEKRYRMGALHWSAGRGEPPRFPVRRTGIGRAGLPVSQAMAGTRQEPDVRNRNGGVRPRRRAVAVCKNGHPFSIFYYLLSSFFFFLLAIFRNRLQFRAQGGFPLETTRSLPPLPRRPSSVRATISEAIRR
jgi:hypothetical protein